MLQDLKRLTKEDDEALLRVYLRAATDAVLRRLYPFGPAPADVPAAYRARTVEIAVYLYGKRGAEGETAHSEGDVSRSYESAGIPASMLSDILPFCGMPK